MLTQPAEVFRSLQLVLEPVHLYLEFLHSRGKFIEVNTYLLLELRDSLLECEQVYAHLVEQHAVAVGSDHLEVVARVGGVWCKGGRDVDQTARRCVQLENVSRSCLRGCSEQLLDLLARCVSVEYGRLAVLALLYPEVHHPALHALAAGAQFIVEDVRPYTHKTFYINSESHNVMRYL